MLTPKSTFFFCLFYTRLFLYSISVLNLKSGHQLHHWQPEQSRLGWLARLASFSFTSYRESPICFPLEMAWLARERQESFWDTQVFSRLTDLSVQVYDYLTFCLKRGFHENDRCWFIIQGKYRLNFNAEVSEKNSIKITCSHVDVISHHILFYWESFDILKSYFKKFLKM